MRTATPLFANVKDDHSLVRRYYLILAEILTLIVMPLMAGLAIVTPLAVPVVFGARWIAAIAPVRWLALFMIVRTMGTLTEQVLISQKMTRFTMRMSIFNFIVMPIAFVAGAHWQGMGGVAAAWLVLSPFTIVPLLIILLPDHSIAVPRLCRGLGPFSGGIRGDVPRCVGRSAVVAAGFMAVEDAARGAGRRRWRSLWGRSDGSSSGKEYSVTCGSCKICGKGKKSPSPALAPLHVETE